MAQTYDPYIRVCVYVYIYLFLSILQYIYTVSHSVSPSLSPSLSFYFTWHRPKAHTNLEIQTMIVHMYAQILVYFYVCVCAYLCI